VMAEEGGECGATEGGGEVLRRAEKRGMVNRQGPRRGGARSHGARQHKQGSSRALTGGPRPGKEKKKLIQILKMPIQIYANLIHSKSDLSLLQKFEIKYGCEEFDVSNNFPYRNILRFKMNFE
jgi:hypothetical protein